MARLKPSELRKMKDGELQGKLQELRAELTKLKSAAGRGTIRKESGKIRAVRRNIARMLTVLNERLLEGVPGEAE